MNDQEKPPPNPYRVLALAIFLPGWGHWLAGYLQRGVTFVFFMVILGWITWRLAPVDRSFIGRYAGGLFIYAISIPDAYRLAKQRMEVWRKQRLEKEIAAVDAR